MLLVESRHAAAQSASRLAKGKASLATSCTCFDSDPRKTRQALDSTVKSVLSAAIFGVAAKEPADIEGVPQYLSNYRDQGFRPTPTRGLRNKLVEVDWEKVRRKQSDSRTLRKSWTRDSASFTTSARSALQTATQPGPSLYADHAFGGVSATDARLLNTLGGSDDPVISEVSRDVDMPDAPDIVAKTRMKVSPQDLVPGTLLECRKMDSSALGIYLGPDEAGQQIIILPTYGHYSIYLIGDVTFVAQPLVPPHVARLVRNTLDRSPTKEETQAQLRIAQEVRRVELAVAACKRELIDRGILSLYDTLWARQAKQNRDKESLSVTTEQALRALGYVTNTMSNSRLADISLAVHLLLMDDAEHFVCDSVSHRVTSSFALRPPAEVQAFKRVRQWIRTRSNEIAQFTTTAARARHWGQKHPPAFDSQAKHLATHAPVQVRDADGEIKWSATDLEIIQFLRRSVKVMRTIQRRPYLEVATTILKIVDDVATTKYGTNHKRDMYDFDYILAFLGEIGVTAPWENWVVHAEGSLLPDWDKTEVRLRPSTRPSASVAPRTLGPKDLIPVDPHDAVRHDFGDLPVYAIDDATALELDDGLSVEAAAPQAGLPTWWIHVHIADPTHKLHIGHEIALAARTRMNSEYHAEKHWPMLPSWFVRGRGLSLGSKLNGRAEEKTLTFSARVDEAGHVLETNVRTAVVRNVRCITYGAVNDIVGFTLAPRSVLTLPLWPTSLDVQSAPARPTDDESVKADGQARDDLRRLRTLTANLMRARVQDGALFFDLSHSIVSVHPAAGHHFEAAQGTHPVFYRTAPSVSLTLPSATEGQGSNTATMMVSEAMVLANRIAARFCVERGIPIPYRSQGAPDVRPELLAEVMALRNPATGKVPVSEIMKREIVFRAAREGIAPGPHWPMGIADRWGYAKASSPLRRYLDLVAHWQIKSALLPKHTKPSRPPVSKDEMKALLREIEYQEALRGRNDKYGEAFWSLYLIKSKLALADELPAVDPFASQVLSNLTGIALAKAKFSMWESSWIQKLDVPQLGIRAQLWINKEVQGQPIGSEIPIKLSHISLSSRSLATAVLK